MNRDNILGMLLNLKLEIIQKETFRFTFELLRAKFIPAFALNIKESSNINMFSSR
jgi:hypothetical protein